MKKSDITTFGIVGGDKRQLFLAKSISDSCYDVILGGFDKLQSTGAITLADVKTATPSTINVYDIMKYNTVVVAKEAVATIEEVYA